MTSPISAVTTLAEGENVSAPLVIAMPQRTFLAAHTVGYGGAAVMATLRCRADAPSGVPQQIRLP